MSGAFELLRPGGWKPPQGYADGIAVRGRQIYVSGQVGWNPATTEFETDELVEQVRRALENVVAVLRAGGAGPEHLVRLTWYVTSREAYAAARREIGEAYRDVIGRHFPAMTLVVVQDLLESRAQVEIEATAVVPDA